MKRDEVIENEARIIEDVLHSRLKDSDKILKKYKNTVLQRLYIVAFPVIFLMIYKEHCLLTKSIIKVIINFTNRKKGV